MLQVCSTASPTSPNPTQPHDPADSVYPPEPHPHLVWLQVLQTVVSDGGRPLFPESTPAWYSALAMRCWSTAPKQRPSFRRILLQLQAIEEEPGSS